ncbi:MAG: hypothetical protein Q7R60_03825 [bacterium]|nr:hypothetical protein [bacterium]
MSNSVNEQRPKKVEVFFTDEQRLTALAQAHRELLADEASGVVRLTETLYTADELVSIIDGHKLAVDSLHPVPAILQLELDEAQVGTLSLARYFANKVPGQSLDANVLLG